MSLLQQMTEALERVRMGIEVGGAVQWGEFHAIENTEDEDYEDERQWDGYDVPDYYA